MSSDQGESNPRNSTKRQTYGAPEKIHDVSFRAFSVKLPNSPHRVQMKHLHGVELLLVHLDGESEPYYSLRYLEAALGQPDLEAFLREVGIRLKIITLEEKVGILPDIINLRSGILEPHPLLIKLQAVECILKKIGLADSTPKTDATHERAEKSTRA